MSDLYNKMREAFDKVKNETIYGTRYVPTKDEDDDDADRNPDFPYITDPKGFVTHIPLEQGALKEQGDKPPTTPSEAGAEAGADIGAAPPEGGEGGIGDMGMDAAGNMPGVEGGAEFGMGAGMPQEEQLTVTEIGRVYELKKIYSRLSSVETFLSRTTDESMLEIRKLVSQSIDLFEIVISNIGQFKEKIDEIIVTYYTFLESVYGSIKTYFSEMSKE